MKDIVNKRKDIAFYIKLFPLDIHKGARENAQEIECKHSLKLLEDSFEGKAIPKPECKTTVIDSNIALAKSLNVNGTPAIILPDGAVVTGALPEDALLSLIDNVAKGKLSPGAER